MSGYLQICLLDCWKLQLNDKASISVAILSLRQLDDVGGNYSRGETQSWQGVFSVSHLQRMLGKNEANNQVSFFPLSILIKTSSFQKVLKVLKMQLPFLLFSSKRPLRNQQQNMGPKMENMMSTTTGYQKRPPQTLVSYIVHISSVLSADFGNERAGC